MKRIVLMGALVAALLAQPVGADTTGAKRMARANRHCAQMAALYERHGFTERELRRLAAEPCKVDRDGRWTSAKVFTQ